MIQAVADSVVLHPSSLFTSRLLGATNTLSSTFDTVSPFSSPQRALICQKNGLLYVCDAGNHRIQVLTPAGELLHEFGGRGHTHGRLMAPLDMAVWRERLFVCDTGNQRVEAFSLTGEYRGCLADADAVTPAELSSETADGIFLNRPVGLAVCPRLNRIFVSDSNAHRVLCFSLAVGRRKATSGTPYLFTYLFAVGGPGKGKAQLDWPQGIAVYGDQLYVCDAGHHRISVFDARSGDFVHTLAEGKAWVRAPYGIAATAASVFVTVQGLGTAVHEFPRAVDAKRAPCTAPRVLTPAAARGGAPLHFVSASADGRLLVCDGQLHAVHALVPLPARLRRWRVVARLAAALVCSHQRAVERLYAPGGAGYQQAAASFAASQGAAADGGGGSTVGVRREEALAEDAAAPGAEPATHVRLVESAGADG